MTAYKFQPALNNPYLHLSQGEDDEETLKNLNSNEFTSNDNYLSGNTETVLDLIEHNYSNGNLVDIDGGVMIPNGTNTNNPNLFSRKLQNSPV